MLIFTGNIIPIVLPDLSFSVLRWKYIRHIKKCAAQNKPFVFRVKFGGLGDHLVYSALPEALFQKYGVYSAISTSSEFRAETIYDFVWKDNPYCTSTDKKGLFPYVFKYKKYQNYNEVVLGLFDIKNHELFSTYYSPKTHEEARGKIVCDLTFGPSGLIHGYDRLEFREKVLSYFQRFDPSELLFLEPQGYSDGSVSEYVRSHFDAAAVAIHSPFELADYLCSGKYRVFLDSGAKSVAAAYKQPSLVLDTGKANPYFRYPTNEYVIL